MAVADGLSDLRLQTLFIRYAGGLIKLLPGEEDDIEAIVCQLMLIKIKLFLDTAQLLCFMLIRTI